jgi:hypothetical protein
VNIQEKILMTAGKIIVRTSADQRVDIVGSQRVRRLYEVVALDSGSHRPVVALLDVDVVASTVAVGAGKVEKCEKVLRVFLQQTLALVDSNFGVLIEVCFQFLVLVIAKSVPPNHLGFVHVTDGMLWKAAHQFVKGFVGFLQVIMVHLV